MRNAGFTSQEQEELRRIDDIEDPKEKEEEIRKFEERTGKEFPNIVFELHQDTAGLKCTNGDREFDRWFSEERFRR